MKNIGVEEWSSKTVGGICLDYSTASNYFNVSRSYLTGTHIIPCNEDTICVLCS